MSNSEHPYSLVVEVDGIIYVSGATSIDYESHRPISGRRAALDAALDEVENRLASVGASLSNVTKLTYFLKDLSLRQEANVQFLERFEVPRPARTVLQVTGIPYDGVVVIDATAHRTSR